MMAMDWVVIVVGFVPAVVLHELAHGWVANRLGDATAKEAGRLTLNPLRHVDLMGSILLPALLIVTRAPYVFGWAKPVPINIARLRNPRRDLALVALAGPIMNLLLATAGAIILKLIPSVEWRAILTVAIYINIGLAVFNLIPVPPLDGSRLVFSLLPIGAARIYAQLEGVGMLIVFALVSFGILDQIIWPVMKAISHLLGVS